MPDDSAAAWRRRAEQAVREGRYAEAAEAYRREAAVYRRIGDLNAARVEEAKADRWASDVRIFVQAPGARPAPARALPLAKWEPPYGCYVGAFIDRDERLGPPFQDENWQSHRDPLAFARLTGKKPLSVFCYLAYGKPFPAKWVAWLRRRGVVPHIAWEPNGGPAQVQDDDYLRGFADDAARADWPIFLRFASEMNGNWTAYGGDPLRYKIMWGKVRRVMAERAPNVAMVWCPNVIPEKPIPLFYPGDEHVDWVGVNFYSVPFHDNDRRRSGEHENPADELRFLYSRYAARKPIMICEYGASHRSAVDRKDRPEWAALKIAQLYASLPRLYPRVKCIDIFDNDNMRYAGYGRQLNNYSVTDSARVLDAYREAVADDYFLSRFVSPTAPPRAPIVPLAEGASFARGILRVSAWARSHVPRPTVTYSLGGREVFRSRTPGSYSADLRLDRPGAHRLLALVLDDRGRVAARAERNIIVR